MTVWPCDRDGIVDDERLERGEVHVARWQISSVELATLRALHAVGWRFTECDLLVSGGPEHSTMLPTARTLACSSLAPRMERASLVSIAFGVDAVQAA